MKTFKQYTEACWKGYEAIGVKKKGNRTVPNCVPVKEDGVMSAGPTNVVGSGAIAGTGGAGGEPGVNMKKKKPSAVIMKLIKRKPTQ